MGIAKIQGAAITIREDRNKQTLSRNTLSIEEIKDTPATFGDALGALSTLPGVVRSGGLFGQILIRGASDTANRYYIDDIPVLNPRTLVGFSRLFPMTLLTVLTYTALAFQQNTVMRLVP